MRDASAVRAQAQHCGWLHMEGPRSLSVRRVSHLSKISGSVKNPTCGYLCEVLLIGDLRPGTRLANREKKCAERAFADHRLMYT